MKNVGGAGADYLFHCVERQCATLKLNAADAPSNNEGANEMKKESSGRISASPLRFLKDFILTW